MSSGDTPVRGHPLIRGYFDRTVSYQLYIVGTIYVGTWSQVCHVGILSLWFKGPLKAGFTVGSTWTSNNLNKGVGKSSESNLGIRGCLISSPYQSILLFRQFIWSLWIFPLPLYSCRDTHVPCVPGGVLTISASPGMLGGFPHFFSPTRSFLSIFLNPIFHFDLHFLGILAWP